MACEGRARNRMLRKRWIVRNPVVGEDDVTQFILARSFNTLRSPVVVSIVFIIYLHMFTTKIVNFANVDAH